MVTNNQGQTVAAFVEIDGVARASWTYEDCRTSYDSVNGGSQFANGGWCDSTGNLFDPQLAPNYSTSCSSTTDPTCWGRIHVEFDGDWFAAGYCGLSTSSCNNNTLVQQTIAGSTTTLMDVQGYIYWDPVHVASEGHSFSGWELHPFTAWRPHQSSTTADFVLSASPPDLSTAQGAIATSKITVSSLGSFSGTVALSTSVSPVGPKVSLSSPSVNLSPSGSATSTLSFQASTAGNYTVTVQGTSGTLTRKISLHVNVKASPDFLILLNPSLISTAPGTPSSSTITLTSLNGFSGQVSLSATVSAGGFGVQINPNNPTLASGGNATSHLTITSPNDGAPDNYTVTLTGKGGSIIHTATIPLALTGFALAINPGDISFSAGGSGDFSITLASLNHFRGNVTLSDQVSNNNLIATLSSTIVQVPPAGTVLALLRVSSSANGGYQVTVSGSFGKLVRKVSVTVDVTTGHDFTLSANPIFTDITLGSSGSFAITAASVNGLSGSVNLKANVNPGGPIVSLNPTSIGLASGSQSTSTLTLSVPVSTHVGLYSIVVEGASGPTHTVTLWLYVTRPPPPDFALSSNPGSQVVTVGSSATYVLTLTSLNQFSGSVTVSVSPQVGLASSLNPPVISMSPASSATSNLNITTSSTTPPATYTITVTSTSGSLVHATMVSLVVNGVPDFALQINPAALTILAGKPGNATVALNNFNGFSDSVSLASTIFPSTGLTCTISPATISGSGTSTLFCSGSAGSYTVTVTGTSGSLSHSSGMTFTVQDFAMSANPETVSTGPNQPGASTINIVVLQGFNGRIDLTSNSTYCTLTPTSVYGPGSTNLSCTFSSAGTVYVTVTGTSAGLSHSATVTYGVGIAPSDFQISANPTSVNLYSSTTNTSVVSITAINGFSGNVSLSAAVQPGFSFLFNKNPIAAGSTSTLSLSGAANVATGTYTINVTGTSDNLIHSATISIRVLTTPSIAFVAAVPVTGTSSNSATTSALTFVKGDLIVVYVTVGSGQTVTSITDSGSPSSSYTLTVSAANGNTITFLYTATAGTSTNNTITVKTSASGNLVIDAAEYSGVVGFGASNTSTGTGTAVSVSLTTQHTNSWVVVAYGWTGSGGHTGDTGFIDRHGGSSGTQHLDIGDTNGAKPVGTYTFSATLAESDPWAMIALELV